ncbi:hypothetical protein CDA63_04550 [Hymenobacter amundsenii]|uniref:Secretion system C-terminal sorting domain-containing protein n=1 Tax=Hymenobacter amundsenii TaxID=2006685 RepID=A0A246FNL6_9BACT|nr:T9SS type A sorting domain-containing protein [Hymenobacter amundsenii]OWP64312.1 hypothetical protein CDA63_04550 [Hymenobacter amundsenii]
MKTSTFLGFLLALLIASPAAQAQTAAAAAPIAAQSAPVALITDKTTVAPASTAAIKVRLETNPVTRHLIVRTDASGPTRVELNGADGHPVLTRDLLAGDLVSLDVSRLPMGSYLVKCTSGERSGTKRVILGQ